MDVSNWIALGILVITIGGFVLALQKNGKNNRKFKKDIDEKLTTERVNLINRVNENAARILEIWKEIEKMKRHNEKEIDRLRVDLKEYDKKNREDFRLVHSKIDDAANKISAAAALIESHVK